MCHFQVGVEIFRRRRSGAIYKGAAAFQTVIVLGRKPPPGVCSRWQVLICIFLGFVGGASALLCYLLKVP